MLSTGRVGCRSVGQLICQSRLGWFHGSGSKPLFDQSYIIQVAFWILNEDGDDDDDDDDDDRLFFSSYFHYMLSVSVHHTVVC